ncbi:MAG: ABC transporter permease [Anaerolineae bacterium]|nr:ABC transporter permease [Anaerolineae bacterium]
MKQSIWGKILILIGAVVGALLVGALLLLIAGANPLVAYRAMLIGPLSSRYGITEALVKATPLLLVGLGIVIAFRSGILNIGGEGQMVIGALAGSACALALPDLPGILLLPMTLLSSFLAGAVWGGIPGWLKARLSVNEILSTIMLNSIALQLVTFMLRGPLIDPQEIAYGTGFPQTAQLPEQSWLPRLIPRTRLHWGFVVALLLAGLVYVFLWRTSLGYRMRAVGAQKEAARYGGIQVENSLVLAMALSGGFAGLAGMVEVLGIHHRLLDGISAGYGFSGIVAALFGQLHPLGTIPAAILFGALTLGADMMQRAVEVPAAIVLTIQGLVVLFVVGSDVLMRRPDFLKRLLGKRMMPIPEETSQEEVPS